jgi:anthranilate synthase component 2
LIVDNYDSFTFNLVQLLGELGADPLVFRNDQITLEGIVHLGPTHIVISPGPKGPEEAGVSLEIIRALAREGIPILGVCLGHQAIAVGLGGTVGRSPVPVHGKTSQVFHHGGPLYRGVPSPFSATRYHSLEVKTPLPQGLKVSAWTAEGTVMGIRHKTRPVEGVQFHPESILTEHGRQILSNFLSQRKRPSAGGPK